jgi:transcriptional regulator of acetoin/glycerol metabolism
MADIGGVGLLTDANCAIVESFGDSALRRRVEAIQSVPGALLTEDVAGNNAVGTAVEEECGVQMWSAEHYVEACLGFFCTALPIRDPLSRRILGVLSLSVREQDTNRALAAMIARTVANAVSDVERRLVDQLALREQALLFHYLRDLGKRAGRATIASDGRTTIASNGAVSLLEPDDYSTLSAYAEEALRGERRLERQITLKSGREVQVVLSPRFEGGESIGVIMRLTLSRDDAASSPADMPPSWTPFHHLAGRSQAFRRALQLAAGAVVHPGITYVEGEAGTGKFELARAIAEAIGGQCVTLDCEAIDTHIRVLQRLLRHSLSDAAVVIIRHADILDPTAWNIALNRVKGEQIQPLPRLIVTVRSGAPHSGQWHAVAQATDAIQIMLPPLHERREDIPLLVESVLAKIDPDRHIHVSPALSELVARTNWPGNIRQLETAVRCAAAVARTSEIDVADLPDEILKTARRTQLSRLEDVELTEIQIALREAHGNRALAAGLLGIGRSTLYRKLDTMRAHGLIEAR